MVKIQILFFATLKEKTGISILKIEIPEGFTLAQLKAEVTRRYPQAALSIEKAVSSINQKFSFDADEIPDGAEVAFFPPVSGGRDLPTWVEITRSELNYDDLLARVTLPTTGAACTFSGIVRAQTKRGKSFVTEALEYEAYQPMAEAKMRQIVDEIRSRWTAVEGVAIVQRIGFQTPGEQSVLIICTSAHRDDGLFEAAHYGIDRLKEIVPVWKKEISADGSIWVEGEYYPEKGE